MFRVQPLVYLKGPLPGSLPPTVLPIILLPCLKGPVGLMISYCLVDTLTQREDEWRGPAPAPARTHILQQIEDEGGPCHQEYWEEGSPGEALQEHYQGPFLGSSNGFHKGDGCEQNELPSATLQVPRVLGGYESCGS